MSETAVNKIEVGRRVRYHLPFGDMPEGLIVAVHGELTGRKPSPGVMQRIYADDATFDIVTFDGRMIHGKREIDVGRLGIGNVELLDRVHGPGMLARAPHLVAERAAAEAMKQASDRDSFERGEAARVIEDPPVFYWNGIKDAKGAKLQKAYYSGGPYTNHPDGTLSIYARDYSRFSAKVHACFEVQNDSDVMTDYFDKDRIRVIPSHPLYAQVQAAMEKAEARNAKRYG